MSVVSRSPGALLDQKRKVNGPQSSSESSWAQWDAVNNFTPLPLSSHTTPSLPSFQKLFSSCRVAPYALTKNLSESLHSNLSTRKIASPWSTPGPMHLVQDPWAAWNQTWVQFVGKGDLHVFLYTSFILMVLFWKRGVWNLRSLGVPRFATN